MEILLPIVLIGAAVIMAAWVAWEMRYSRQEHHKLRCDLEQQREMQEQMSRRQNW